MVFQDSTYDLQHTLSFIKAPGSSKVPLLALKNSS